MTNSITPAEKPRSKRNHLIKAGAAAAALAVVAAGGLTSLGGWVASKSIAGGEVSSVALGIDVTQDGAWEAYHGGTLVSSFEDLSDAPALFPGGWIVGEFDVELDALGTRDGLVEFEVDAGAAVPINSASQADQELAAALGGGMRFDIERGLGETIEYDADLSAARGTSVYRVLDSGTVVVRAILELPSDIEGLYASGGAVQISDSILRIAQVG